MKLTILNPKNPEQEFPPSDKALAEPEGLLAIGGCLSEKRLLNAYRHGIFPWYNPGEPILWWSPDPRLVLFPEHVVISRSLRKTLRKSVFRVTF
ncbi:leucyl/phenylalanyl-tRNA--protein transferase [Methylocucumis oryzae]|uniref:leucyl/phenylalanyl-tRNA--protein transferase n=1 Tax=Methylocucumis oryzae TaxID=1632867 RepID=UPI000AE8344A